MPASRPFLRWRHRSLLPVFENRKYLCGSFWLIFLLSYTLLSLNCVLKALWMTTCFDPYLYLCLREDSVPSIAEAVVSFGPMRNPKKTKRWNLSLWSSCKLSESVRLNLLKFIDLHKMAHWSSHDLQRVHNNFYRIILIWSNQPSLWQNK